MATKNENIAKGLIDIALNNSYNEKFLRDAKMFLDLSKSDIAVINRYLSGDVRSTDHISLQEIANFIARKANPTPRKRAAKRAPSLYGAKMKHLESALSALNMLIDKGAEFPDAVIKVSESTGVDIEVLTAEYDNYWRAWSELSSAYRKTNPAKRPAPKKRAISRPSQVTKKAPSKRLVSRRKVAAKKPVKGYFPNPAKKPAPHSALPYCVQLEYEGRGWKTVAAFAAQIPAENHAHGIAKKFPDGPSIRVIKK